MSDLEVCRVCLITGVRMCDLREYPLDCYFQPIIGMSLVNTQDLPMFACYECAAFIKKYHFFREKCLRGQAALYEMLHIKQQITLSDIQTLDRYRLDLVSDLAATIKIRETTVLHYYEQDNIKEESDIKLTEDFIERFVSEVDVIKEEIDNDYFDDPTVPSSSDEDEPLSLHKIKKTTEREKVKDIERIVEIESIAEAVVEPEESKFSDFLDKIDVPVHKVPRVRKKHNTDRNAELKQKKKRGPKKCVGLTPDEINMEEYVTIIKLTLEEQLAEVSARQLSANYKNAPLKCPQCYKGFVDKLAYSHHMTKHDPSTGDVECIVCKFRFKTRRMLQKHEIIHEKKYSCKSCSYVSKTTTQAKQHHKWHKGVTYKCQYCDEISTKWTSHLSHVRIKHPSEFVCSVCGYSFVSKLGLNMHKTMMHKNFVESKEEVNVEGGHYCEKCGVQFSCEEAYKRHMIMSTKHSQEKQFKMGCRTCGSMFTSSEELRLHHRHEHPTKRPKSCNKKPDLNVWPTKCKHCGELVSNARDYWSHHRRAHPDEKYPVHKSYICEICGKGFRGNAFLVYHKRTHFEERNYKCGQCSKAFFNRTNLQMHEKTHSDHRPYPCDVCFKAFKSKGALDRHYRSHTGVKPYKCEFCGKCFGQSNSCKLHVRTVHLKQPAPYLSKTRLERRRHPDGKQHFTFLTQKI